MWSINPPYDLCLHGNWWVCKPSPFLDSPHVQTAMGVLVSLHWQWNLIYLSSSPQDMSHFVFWSFGAQNTPWKRSTVLPCWTPHWWGHQSAGPWFAGSCLQPEAHPLDACHQLCWLWAASIRREGKSQHLEFVVGDSSKSSKPQNLKWMA